MVKLNHTISGKFSKSNPVEKIHRRLNGYNFDPGSPMAALNFSVGCRNLLRDELAGMESLDDLALLRDVLAIVAEAVSERAEEIMEANDE